MHKDKTFSYMKNTLWVRHNNIGDFFDVFFLSMEKGHTIQTNVALIRYIDFSRYANTVKCGHHLVESKDSN